MKKILRIAQREFLATAGTKAFILGMFVTPAMIAVMIFVMPRMMQKGAPKVEGEVAVIDATGTLSSGLQAYLRPDAIARRRQDEIRKMQDAMPPALRAAGGGSAVSQAAVDQAFKNAIGDAPRLSVTTLEPGADLEGAKRRLAEVPSKDKAGTERIALVVVHADAVVLAPGKAQFGSYDLFVRGKLDDRVVDEITGGMRDAIIESRVRLSGLDRAQIDALTKVDRVRSRTVTASGENATNEVLNLLMPMAMMGLLLMSVMMSGSYLLTTTVEEKMSRVVEVLLSAVSPMELMAGKILGQLAVGLLVLALYLGLGLMALISFASLGMLDPMLIVYLLVFYLIAYVSVAAFMAAIGSAVNEMREAQGLMMPMMIVLMIPWFLWMPISRDPNSVLAVTLSFLPPLSNFVMMLRLASTTPPPVWQPLLAIVVGAAGAYGCVWFASKVFRIGLLMYGKPPSMTTLVRWVRTG
ncbi:MAG: ABC transporter permease [Acidobacteriota bacterium]